MAAEKLPVQVACTVPNVSESSCSSTAPPARSQQFVRHAILSDLLIGQFDVESHGLYGARRIHAEFTLGRGVMVDHYQVELLVRGTGLQPTSGRRKWNRIRSQNIASLRAWLVKIPALCAHAQQVTRVNRTRG